jgi:hypothetical protein
MPYRQRIETLTESHRLIDQTITEMEKSGADPHKIIEMKKKKLNLFKFYPLMKKKRIG